MKYPGDLVGLVRRQSNSTTGRASKEHNEAEKGIDSCCMKQEKADVCNIEENGAAGQENCSRIEKTPASDGTITEKEDTQRHIQS